MKLGMIGKLTLKRTRNNIHQGHIMHRCTGSEKSENPSVTRKADKL